MRDTIIRYNRDNDARSPSDALASRILLTSPSPRKHKPRIDEPALPFTHAKNKSPLPIFKGGKRSPGKAGSVLHRDNLPRFGAELPPLLPAGDLDHQGSGLLDEVDLDNCYYGWNKAKGDDADHHHSPFSAHPDDKGQRVLKRKLFSPTSNTARTLAEVFPLGDTDLLGAENHAPTGSINVTPQRLRSAPALDRELSLQVYVNQSPAVSPAGAGSPLLPHHGDAVAAASPMGVSLPVPLLLHSPELREPHGKVPLHFSSMLGNPPQLATGPPGSSIPPLLNLPPPPPDTHPTPMWDRRQRDGRASATSSSDVPQDDSSDEDYTESPVRGRARSSSRSGARNRRGKVSGTRFVAKDSLAMQQVKAAPARRGAFCCL